MKRGYDYDKQEPDSVIAKSLTMFGREFNDRTKQYHSPLPSELEPWYCYPPDSGHSILVVLEKHAEEHEGIDPIGGTVPAPVKQVLREGYRINEDGWVVCNLPYSDELGLLCEDGDDEY
jgi:hypothetical protein